MPQGFLKGLAHGFLAGRFSGIQGIQSGPPEYTLKVVAAERGITVSAYLPENFSSSVNSDYDTPFSEGFLSDRPNLKLGLRVAGVGTTTQVMSMQVWQGSAPMEFSIPMVFLYDNDEEQDILGPVRSLMSLTLPSEIRTNGTGLNLEENGIGSLEGTGGVLQSPGPKLALSQITDENGEQREVTGADFVNAATGLDTARAATDALDDASQLLGDVGDTFAGELNDFAENINDLFGGLGVFGFTAIRDNISLKIGNFLYFPSVVITDVSSDYSVKLSKQRRKPISLEVTVSFRTFITPKTEDLSTIIPR